MSVFGEFSPFAEYVLYLLLVGTIWLPALLRVLDREEEIRAGGKPIWRAYLAASILPILLLACVTFSALNRPRM